MILRSAAPLINDGECPPAGGPSRSGWARRSSARTIGRRGGCGHSVRRGLLFVAQADVQRRRLAAANFDLRHISAIAGLTNLNRVGAFREVDDQPILLIRSAPVIAVDRSLGIGRLDTDRHGPIRRRRLAPRAGPVVDRREVRSPAVEAACGGRLLRAASACPADGCGPCGGGFSGCGRGSGCSPCASACSACLIRNVLSGCRYTFCLNGRKPSRYTSISCSPGSTCRRWKAPSKSSTLPAIAVDVHLRVARRHLDADGRLGEPVVAVGPIGPPRVYDSRTRGR